MMAHMVPPAGSIRPSVDSSLGTIGEVRGRGIPEYPHIIGAVSGTHVVRFHGFVLDEGRRLLSRGGQPVRLTRKAFDLLALLIEHAPHVVTKDELHRRLWRETFVTDVDRRRRRQGDPGRLSRS